MCDLIAFIAFDPGVVGEGGLIELAVEFNGILGPAIEHHLDPFFEDFTVLQIIGAPIRNRCDRAGGLSKNVGPTRLIASCEADEIFAMGEVIDDRGFFGHANRILSGHHIAEGSQMQVFHLACPMGVEDAGVGADLITFRMEVMLDG